MEEVVKRMIMLLRTFQAGRMQAHLWHSEYSEPLKVKELISELP